MTTKEDSEIFRQAVKDVKPLKKQAAKVIKNRPPVSLKKKSSTPAKKTPVIELVDDYFKPCDVDENLFFAISGLQQKTIKKLRQGKITYSKILDLHGMTLPEAKDSLQTFLAQCKQDGLRSVIIIHGKGLSIIKSAVNTWLRNYPNTLAFCSAQPSDGGAGAIYLLLKRI